MPFQPVSENEDNSGGGNFPTQNRKFYNLCGQLSYCANLSFQDAKHKARLVPIFLDDCLEDKPQSYALLRQLRQVIRGDGGAFGAAPYGIRSIHQNENGYLPYVGGQAGYNEVAAPDIYMAARLYGDLPNNQKQAKQKDRGQFQEYTMRDDLAQEGRFVVDFRFGLIYMTIGHYHAESFALLIRSKVSLDWDVRPILAHLGVTVTP